MTFRASGVLLAITALLFTLSGGTGPLGFDPRYFSVIWAAIFFFASTAASTAYLTTGELFPLEIRALAFAIVFTASMVVGGVFGAALSYYIDIETWRQALPYLYLFAAFLMVLVAYVVAPNDEKSGVLAFLRLSRETFPDKAGQPPVESPAQA
jgi:MFS family permease